MSSYVECRSCYGVGKKWITKRGRYGTETIAVPCKACGGSGINNRVYATRCQKCYAEIIYPRDIPNSPKYCRSCKAAMQAEREAERALQAAKWKTKPCAKCGVTIKYNTDWQKVPDLCKACADKEKAKWRTKTCTACGKDIRYNIEWPRPPEFCRECANILRILRDRSEADKRRALERWHSTSQAIQSGDKKSGNYVTVKSGYNKRQQLLCSDFIIRDQNVHGQHYHIIIDINGNIVFEGYRDDH